MCQNYKDLNPVFVSKLRVVQHLLVTMTDPGYMPVDACVGICYTVGQLCNFDLRLIPDYEAALRRWPYFSGDTTFPVPPDASKHHDREAANLVYITKHTPASHWTGEYGRLRRDLARHLAQHLAVIISTWDSARGSNDVHRVEPNRSKNGGHSTCVEESQVDYCI